MDQYASSARPPPNRRPFADAAARTNIAKPQVRHGKARAVSAPTGRLPHNESFLGDGTLAIHHGLNFPRSTDEKRKETQVKEEQSESKRNSAVSNTSTLASNPPSGQRRKIHIGPWHLGATIGTGGTSKVRLVRHKHTGQKAVAKIVSKNDADRLRAVSMAHLNIADMALAGGRIIPFGLEREIVIMKLLDHKNIVRLYDVWENRNEIYIIMEYVEGGELFYYIQEHVREGLEETYVVYLFRQIIAALLYCHRIHIHHRDLKPENILLDQKNMEIKLVDFGMAALQAPGKYLTTACGSPHYAAPELLGGNVRYDGSKIDVWSCGVILYVMLTGTPPFNFASDTHPAMIGDRHMHVLFKKIRAGDYQMPSWISVEAQDLISRIFQVDPRKRISIESVWAHPFMHKYDKQFGMDPRLDSGLGDGPRIENWNELDRRDIDREILRGLRCLWHSESEETLVEKLTNAEGNYEKYFYSALIKHREEFLENFAGFVEHSASDYQHSSPASNRAAPPVPISRSKSAYSILNNEHLQSIRSLAEPPASEISYDPFRASRDPIIKGSRQYMNVVVHRDSTGNDDKTLKPPDVNHIRRGSFRMEPLRSGSFQSAYLPRSFNSLHGSSAPKLSSSHRLSAHRLSNHRLSAHRNSVTQSRSSLGSSGWPSSPPVGGIKPNTMHKRGVQFPHLRKSSTTSAITTTSHQQSTDDTIQATITSSLRIVSPLPDATSRSTSPRDKPPQVQRSHKETDPILVPQLRIRKAKDPIREVDREARKVSAELDKLCQEAFYRSSISSSNRSSAIERQTIGFLDTPPSSISQHSPSKIPAPLSFSSRPLPPLPSDIETPKTFTARELAETRNRIAARFAEAGSDNADHFRDVLSHLDSLLPPSTQAVDGRRATSAPQPVPKYFDDLGYLPVISEEGRHSDTDEFERIREPVKLKSDHRAVTEPVNLKIGPSSEARIEVPTVRLVDPSSPAPIAPLNIRKKSSSSTIGSTATVKKPRYYAVVNNGTVNRRTGVSSESTEFDAGADYKTTMPSSPPTLMLKAPSTIPMSSSTAVEEVSTKAKKRGWFKRLASDVKDQSDSKRPVTPIAASSSNSHPTRKPKPKSSPRTWEDLDDRLTKTPKLPPPSRQQNLPFTLTQPRFNSRLSDAPWSDISEFPMRREASDRSEQAPPKVEDNILKGLRKLFARIKLDKDKERTAQSQRGFRLASPDDYSSSDLGTPTLETGSSSAYGRSVTPAPESQPTNWLAKFLHIKPASKVLCFQVGRGRVRQEMVRLLRDWKRFGVRDVAFDRATNIVSWRIDKNNHLKIKPVSVVAELFVVLEHGHRAQLAIARFTQVRGAASSFRKVVDTLEEVISAKGLLVEDEAKKIEMVQILG